MSNFNQKEWFYAVFLARSILDLSPRNDFGITESDLKNAAIELLQGLLDRAEGKLPGTSKKTREIFSIIESEAVMQIARNGGGVQ